MDQPSDSPVMEVINRYLDHWPEESHGYIIALPAEHGGPMGRMRWYAGHDRPWAGLAGVRIMAASADQIHRAVLYETYQEAWEMATFCAKHWRGGQFADDMRIVEVTRRSPLIVHNARPLSVLDALAEI